MLQKLISGGAGYLIIALVATGAIGTVVFKYNHAISRAEQAESALAEEMLVTASQRQTIASQARTGQRRAAATTTQQITEDAINDVTDSTQCANSEPIRRGFNLMRNNTGAKVDNNAK